MIKRISLPIETGLAFELEAKANNVGMNSYNLEQYKKIWNNQKVQELVKTVLGIAPPLIALIVAVNMLKSSGGLNIITDFLSPVASFLKINFINKLFQYSIGG